MEQHLVTIQPQTALQVFTSPDAIDPLLKRVRQEIDAFEPDVSSARGRKDIASIAYRVAQTKTHLESIGKRLADEQKDIPKKIDATRKRIRDTLDDWKDEVRKPLTEWETAEEARIARHENAINTMGNSVNALSRLDEMKVHLAHVQSVVIGSECEEFEAAYARAKDAAIADISRLIAERERYEAEQAELARLRQEAAERAERDRIAEIQRKAAEQARLEAEAAARANVERAEAAAKAEREQAEKRERDLRQAAADAERRAKETEERVRREALQKAADEAAAQARREANRAHRAKVNNKAMTALVAGGMAEEVAKLAVTLIAAGSIPAVTIAY